MTSEMSTGTYRMSDARELSRLSKPGGRVIVSVPALPDLYSEFDEVQGHRHRYTAQSLRTCLEGAGLVVEDILWWGQWMVAPLRARKRRPRGQSHDAKVDVYKRYLALPPWPAPWAMRIMLRIDRWRTLRHRNATGTSLIAIAALASAQAYSRRGWLGASPPAPRSSAG